MTKTFKRLLIILALMLVAATPLSGGAGIANDQGMYSLVERFGIGYSGGVGFAISQYDLDQLQIGDTFPFGWYCDWGTSINPLRSKGMEYAQLLKVGPNHYNLEEGPLPIYWTELGMIIAQHPGAMWLIGNEPERGVYQGSRTPDEYARIYHQLYAFIKGQDPTAQVVVGGVVQASPLRLKWLDAVLASYLDLYGEPMPMDAWSIHEQILPEIEGSWGAEVPVGITDEEGIGLDLTFADNANVELFIQQVTAFRHWMKANGYQDKPLIISEYGVLLPSSLLGEAAGPNEDAKRALGDQMVIDYMTETFDWLLHAIDPEIGHPADGYRLVQRWLWYSLNDEPFNMATGAGFNGSLFVHNQPAQLTQFGRAFQDYALGLHGAKLYLPLGMRNAN